MPGLNCSFRIEEEVDNLIDTFPNDDAETDESDDSVDEEAPVTRTLSNFSSAVLNSMRHDFSDDSESSEDDESSDEGSDDKSEQSSKEKSTHRCLHHNGDYVRQELLKMNIEQSQLAQNLIAAILHEGVKGRLTSDTILKDLSKEIDSPSTSSGP